MRRLCDPVERRPACATPRLHVEALLGGCAHSAPAGGEVDVIVHERAIIVGTHAVHCAASVEAMATPTRLVQFVQASPDHALHACGSSCISYWWGRRRRQYV
eukprot:scaffold40041_cov33-Tisochrysis_lutea.AAC.3